MVTTEKQAPWWRELFRKEAVGAHVVNTLVGLAVTFILGLLMTIFWVTWAAWRGSLVWTQRAIGAAMAFAAITIAIAVALGVLRRRLNPPGEVTAEKGYLDHEMESDKARKEIMRALNESTKITNKETQSVKAAIERLRRIQALPYDKQRREKVKESRRSARSSDRTTRKLDALLPQLIRAIETRSRSEVAYWKWYAENRQMSASDALTLINLRHEELKSIKGWVDAHKETKQTLAGRLGETQVLNEAVGRRVAVLDRWIAVMGSQQAPVEEVIGLLGRFTRQ